MKTASKPRKAPARTTKKRTVKKHPAAQRAAAKRAGRKRAVPKKPGPRADFGAPVEGFFKKQPAELRQILEALRSLIEKAAPDAKSSLKWGMPFYTIDGAMFCALGAHKSHVNLILAGPPRSFDDPEKRLSGGGKTGRHLKLRAVAEVPTQAVRGWLREAAALARNKV